MQANLFRSACFFILSFKPPLDYGIGETTLRGYSEPFRDLNIERLPFSPLRGLTVVKRNDVLNGLSRAFAHASPLTLPNTVVQLLQNATFALTQVQYNWGEVSMRTRWPGGPPVCGAN